LEKDSKVTKDFVEKYKLKYNKEPNVFSAYGYTTINILGKLTQKYGNDTEKIKEGLYNTNSEEVIGNVRFDENGDLMTEIGIYKVINNKFVRIE